jgi:hypothetical protein
MKPRKIIVFVVSVIFILGLALIVYRVVGGRSLGISGIARRLGSIVVPVLGRGEVVKYSTGQFKNIVFIHHSVGNNLIHQGKLRDQFQQLGYSFWDQDYMSEGLTRPDGKPTGYSYNVLDDNTDIDGYAAIFQQPVYKLPINTFSSLLQHEVILFKSCYPNSQIDDDAALGLRKQEYLLIRKSIDQHPDHIFFLLTSPPLNPAETNPAAARRARALTNWLASTEFTSGHPNLFVFNFYDLLAENVVGADDENMLKKEYRTGSDSHPNALANETIAPLLVEFVNHGIEQYRSTYLEQ